MSIHNKASCVVLNLTVAFCWDKWEILPSEFRFFRIWCLFLPFFFSPKTNKMSLFWHKSVRILRIDTVFMKILKSELGRMRWWYHPFWKMFLIHIFSLNIALSWLILLAVGSNSYPLELYLAWAIFQVVFSIQTSACQNICSCNGKQVSPHSLAV